MKKVKSIWQQPVTELHKLTTKPRRTEKGNTNYIWRMRESLMKKAVFWLSVYHSLDLEFTQRSLC